MTSPKAEKNSVECNRAALTYLRGNDSRLAGGKKRSALFFAAAAHRCTRKCMFLKAEVLKQAQVRDKSISVIIFQCVQIKLIKNGSCWHILDTEGECV